MGRTSWPPLRTARSPALADGAGGRRGYQPLQAPRDSLSIQAGAGLVEQSFYIGPGGPATKSDNFPIGRAAPVYKHLFSRKTDRFVSAGLQFTVHIVAHAIMVVTSTVDDVLVA